MDKMPLTMGFFTKEGLKEYTSFTQIYAVVPADNTVALNPLVVMVAEIVGTKRIKLNQPMVVETFYN